MSLQRIMFKVIAAPHSNLCQSPTLGRSRHRAYFWCCFAINAEVLSFFDIMKVSCNFKRFLGGSVVHTVLTFIGNSIVFSVEASSSLDVFTRLFGLPKSMASVVPWRFSSIKPYRRSTPAHVAWEVFVATAIAQKRDTKLKRWVLRGEHAFLAKILSLREREIRRHRSRQPP